jgi:hypothetical protein
MVVEKMAPIFSFFSDRDQNPQQRGLIEVFFTRIYSTLSPPLMDEKSRTELVLVVQQNSISDIIAFLKSLESDVRTFRSLKLWPAVQSKLETVLNIRKVIKNN